ncbi:MAG: AAA family ATPase [Planctomycetia bacterium]|nr:AAA family ATPase [Planctomycetia bacterium]
MSTLDQAFIKAYGQSADSAKTTGRTSATSPTASHAVVPKPHAHFDVAEANRRSMAMTEAPAAPVKLFEPEGRALRAAFEVERFEWPLICARLFTAAGRELRLFTDVLTEQIQRGRKMLAVTGCRRGDGRTTVTMCLAQQLAERGLSVALVDADFRHPQLAEQLGVVPSAGWDDVLQSNLALNEAMIDSTQDRMTLVPLRNPQFDAGVTLQNPRLGVPLRALRESYDAVLLDCEPLAGPEATDYLATLVGRGGLDAALLIHDLHQTSTEAYEHAAHLLNQAPLAAWDIIENFVP